VLRKFYYLFNFYFSLEITVAAKAAMTAAMTAATASFRVVLALPKLLRRSKVSRRNATMTQSVTRRRLTSRSTCWQAMKTRDYLLKG
jgi:hypothetical protein